MADSERDFILFDQLLTEDELIARQTARKFVDDMVLPIIAESYEQARFPLHLVKKMGELGFLGCYLPERYGCAGTNNITYGVIMQELERGDSGIRSFASVQTSLVMYPIFAFGSEEQKRYWLPRLASGEAIGCFGLTEPDHGSDPGSMKTRAIPDGDGYILQGSKMWITNGSIADLAVVWAKDESGKVKGFLVEKDTKGFSAPEIKNKLSLRASITSELVFDECRVPKENMLPGASGLKAPLECLSQARYGIAWGAMGAAEFCYQAALNYARHRIQFGKPIASFQLIQQKLAYMLTEIVKGKLLAYHVGKLKDQGKAKHYHISMAKMNNVEKALYIAHQAREIHGANGISLEYHVMRHACNLESVKTYEGTHDIHLLILGQWCTGIESFR